MAEIEYKEVRLSLTEDFPSSPAINTVYRKLVNTGGVNRYTERITNEAGQYRTPYNPDTALRPLVPIPVLEGQTVLTVTGVALGAEDNIYRNSGIVPKAAYTLATSGGNTTITLSPGEAAVTSSEQLDTNSWHYQNNTI